MTLLGFVGAHALSLIGSSLEASLNFFYKALWSILFGVAVTAAIDVFVDKERMARLLGGRDAKTTGLAGALGAASSACTFGAVTIAQTLFKKGASAESTFSFSLASTNIVFELGILIWVLLGPAYLAAELLSGVLLVAIVYLIARATLPVAIFDEARRSLQERETDFRFVHAEQQPWFEQLKTLHGWYYIAERYLRTLKRIQRSVIIGFLVSGFIAELVPRSVWSTLFVASGSFPGVLENAALGVFTGVFSFIASIGIVPFAAALWVGGAGFAAVLGCIVSDNITVPVISLWRKFYGAKATAYIVVVFYLAMVISSVVIEYLFRLLHAIPTRASQSTLATTLSVHLNYTLVLTLLFLALTCALWAVKRLQEGRLAAYQP